MGEQDVNTIKKEKTDGPPIEKPTFVFSYVAIAGYGVYKASMDEIAQMAVDQQTSVYYIKIEGREMLVTFILQKTNMYMDDGQMGESAFESDHFACKNLEK